jgi:hypothetical protein
LFANSEIKGMNRKKNPHNHINSRITTTRTTTRTTTTTTTKKKYDLSSRGFGIAASTGF